MKEKTANRRTFKGFRQAINDELREHKSSFIVFSILRVLIILCLVRQLFLQNYQSFFLCVLTLALLYVPSWFQVKFKVEVPVGLEISVLCFIYAAEILGEIKAYYITVPFWDTMLHTINGFLCAAVGFSLINLLNENNNLKFSLSPFFLALTAFCFSMTIGVLWEFGECAVDLLFLKDSQKDTIVSSFSTVMLDSTRSNIPIPVKDISDVIIVHSDGTQQALGLGGYPDIGLLDTMKDLFVNFIGAIVFSCIGFVYARNKGKSKTVALFVPEKKKEPALK